MRKLIRYDIKGSSRFILGVLAIMIFSFGVLQYNIFGVVMGTNFALEPGIINQIFIVSSFLVIGITYLVFLLYILNSFNNELSTDRGYLTFTLPVTGYEILGSKIITSLFWIFIMTITVILFNGIFAFTFTKIGGFNIFEYIRSVEFPKISFNGLKALIITFIVLIGDNIFDLMIVYFAMTLRKVSFKGKKYSWIWIIIFIILSIIIGLLNNFIIIKFPYYLDYLNNKILKLSNMEIYAQSIGRTSVNFLELEGVFSINIGTLIFKPLIGLGLFFITGYFLDKKIDI